MWVNGQQIMDRPEWGPDEIVGTPIRLVAGQKADIRIDYREGSGWAGAALSWSGPGVSKQIVPKNALFSEFDAPPEPGNGDGLRGIYHSDRDFGTPVFDRVDSRIDFGWQDGSPRNDIPVDGFSVRWLGQIEPLYTERYTFHAEVDDGVTLIVNGQTLIDQRDWTPAEEYTGSINLVAGEKVDIEVRYNEGTGWAGASLSWSSASQSKQVVPQSQLYSVAAPTPPTPGTGDGLTGEYFDNEDFTGKKFQRTDATIDFNWQDGSPRSDIAADTFSARWTGQIEAQHSELYTFHVEADDAFTLTIGGQVVASIPNWTAAEEYTGTLQMTKGQKVPIELTFVERTGWAGAKLSWSSASQPKQVVPATQLYSGTTQPPIDGTGTGLRGEYFNTKNLTNPELNRVDPTINFDWNQGSPAPGVGAETFSVRWTGQVQGKFGEAYTFRVRGDDGFRLFIDGNRVINEWRDGGNKRFDSPPITFGVGEKKDIRLEYYDNTSNADVRLEWQSASTPWQVVPQQQLYPADAPPPPPPPVDGSFSVETVVPSLASPTYVDFTPDGTMFIAQKDGRIYRFADGQKTLFADLREDVNAVRDRGLMSIAVHPNFPTEPWVYASYTYDPPEAANGSGLAARDKAGNRPARVVRIQATAASNFTVAQSGSGEVILGKNSTWANTTRPDKDSTGDRNLPPSGRDSSGAWIDDYVATDSQSHTIGAVRFGLDGNLYVTVGDGTSYGFTDPRTARVQDIDNLSGKLLRLDPNTGRGLADNPYFNGNPDANRSKVYSVGLRNPFRMAVHPTNGDLYIGDVGWNAYEEINRVDDNPSVGGGLNLGWPWFEGMEGTPAQTRGYRDTAAGQDFYANGPATTPPTYARSHSDGGIAVAVGDFYDGTNNRYPAKYENALFWADYGRGEVEVLEFNVNGTVRAESKVTGNIGRPVAMTQNPADGYLYLVDINGRIARLDFG